MKISVCIDAVLREMKPDQAIRALGSIGVGAYEFWSWEDKDLEAMAAAMRETGLQAAAMCTSAFNLTDPAFRETYVAELRRSVSAAGRIQCTTLITQVGSDTGAERARQRQSIVDGLRACVSVLEQEGVTLVIEPLNTAIDHRGYYLTASEEAFSIVREVGSPRVKVLYDIYHQQIMEGNILNTVLNNLDCIAHMHAAGLPGRHELYFGELYYPAIFAALEQYGYAGYVGLEYTPIENALSGIIRSIKKEDVEWRKVFRAQKSEGFPSQE